MGTVPSAALEAPLFAVASGAPRTVPDFLTGPPMGSRRPGGTRPGAVLPDTLAGSAVSF